LSGPEPIGPLSRQDGGPLFDEPWQAEVLAIADTLSRSGAFTSAEWSAALGEALRLAARACAPDDAGTYYGAALAALESLLVRHGLATREALAEQRELVSPPRHEDTKK
jgi:nitrile hydratase accessory protein